MKNNHRTRITACAVAAVLAGLIGAAGHANQAPAAKNVKMPLAQARQTVDMLNDLYVTSVVLTHGTYVKDRSTPAAAVVARQVFKAMGEKGWPQTRWLSTTGRPFNPDANPKDAFERDAVAALKKGQARFERVENNTLRVATLVPLVDASCGMCHTRDKVGDPIGGLAYTVQLDGK
jgi:hypothetical protein